MIFKVKCGTYRIKGKVYRRNENVTTNADLVTLFPGKFELVQDTPVPMRPNIATVVERSPSKSVEAAFERAASTVFPPEEEPVANVPVIDTVKAATKTETATIEPPVEKKSIKKAIPEAEGWDDMTDEFPMAAGLGFKVMFDGESYQIIDPSKGKVLNKKHVLSKSKDVKSFLKKYFEE